MMKKSKWFTVVLVIIMGVALLAACAKKEEEKSPESNTTPPAQTEQNKGNEGKEEPVSNFNDTGFPIVNEKVTIKMIGIQGPASVSLNDMAIFKEYEEMTNVHVEFEDIPQDAIEERKALMFASPKLPEALLLWMTDQEILEYGANGTLLPLEDLIAEHAPNIQAFFDNNPSYKNAMTTPEGHIYVLPHVAETPNAQVYAMHINKKWLDELEMEVPNNVDELYDVLVAFKQHKPDSIPFNFDPAALIRFFSNGFGFTHTHYNSITEDGTVVPIVKLPQFKEAMAYYNKLYSEGLMSPEVFSMSLQMAYALGHEGKVGAYFGYRESYVGPEYADDYVILPPLEYNGKRTTQLHSALEKGMFAITKDAQNPEIIIRWIDHFFSEEGTKMAFYGPEGMGYVNHPDGTWSVLTPAEGETMSSHRGKLTPNQGGAMPYYLSAEILAKVVPDPDSNTPAPTRNINDEILEYYMPYAKEGLPMGFLTKEEAETVGSIQADYDNFVLQMAGALIMDSNSFNNWDQFMETADKIGVDKLASIYQQMVDRWNSMN